MTVLQRQMVNYLFQVQTSYTQQKWWRWYDSGSLQRRCLYKCNCTEL